MPELLSPEVDLLERMGHRLPLWVLYHDGNHAMHPIEPNMILVWESREDAHQAADFYDSQWGQKWGVYRAHEPFADWVETQRLAGWIVFDGERNEIGRKVVR